MKSKIFKARLTRNICLMVGAYVFFVLVSRWKFLMKVIGKRGEKSTEKKAQLVPLAKTTSNWLLFGLLGHLADVKPWAVDGLGEMPLKILDQRTEWYKTKDGKERDTVRVQIANDTFVFTKDLGLSTALHGKEDTLLRNTDTLRKSWGHLFPTSLPILTGNKWKKVRRMLFSSISNLDFEALPASTNEVMVTNLDNYLTEDTQEVLLWDLFSKVTFDSFHKFAFEVNFETLKGKNLNILQTLKNISKNMSNRILMPLEFLWYLPLQTNRTMFKDKVKLETYMNTLIEERKAKIEKDSSYLSKVKQSNLLDALIVCTMKENMKGHKLSHVEIRDQLITAMFGGFDTTTSSLSLLFVYLARNPQYQEKLMEEIKDIDLSKATKRELDELKYLNSIIKETQRLAPVVPGAIRLPEQDVVINGYKFKEGTSIFSDHQAFGQNPNNWKGATDLKEYKPERWFDFEPEKGVFIPFGFGGRKCPGNRIAETQMQTILAHFCQKYTFHLTEKPIKLVFFLGIGVAPESSMIFKKRK